METEQNMETEQKSNGAVMGIIVIVALLIIGGFFTWQNSVKKLAEQEKNRVELEAIINSENIDTELDALNDDLDATDLNLDIDLDSLE